jgi:hypothetical protein
MGHPTLVMSSTFVPVNPSGRLLLQDGASFLLLQSGNGDLTLQDPGASAFAATIGCTTSHPTAAISATFAPGTHTAVLGCTMGSPTAALSATYSPGTRTATIGATIGNPTVAVAATFTRPIYAALISAGTGSPTLAMAAVTAVVATIYSSPIYLDNNPKQTINLNE